MKPIDFSKARTRKALETAMKQAIDAAEDMARDTGMPLTFCVFMVLECVKEKSLSSHERKTIERGAAVFRAVNSKY